LFGKPVPIEQFENSILISSSWLLTVLSGDASCFTGYRSKYQVIFNRDSAANLGIKWFIQLTKSFQ
jgi:hypothetical protein